ncbi:hypothetical protein Tco_0535673 [Tanacetum coccineum]
MNVCDLEEEKRERSLDNNSEALEITLIDQAHQFVNELGYIEEIHFVSKWRSASPFHLAEEDHRLGNLKFVSKGKKDEVFGMQIPNQLIMDSIRNAPYYKAYLEMVAKHVRKIATEKEGKKKITSKAIPSMKPAIAKQPKPMSSKQYKPAPAKKPKSAQEKPSQPSHLKNVCKGKVLKKRRTPTTEEASTRPSTQLQDDTSANIVRDSSSPADAETGADTNKTNNGGDTEILQIGEEQGDDVSNILNLEEKTVEIDEGQARLDPGKTPESRPPPDDDKMDEDQAGPDPGESRVALARPNPQTTHEEIMANVYPNIHESLKFPGDKHVILEDPLSSPGTLSSLKNLDDAYVFGDQFLNDKSIEDEPRKFNVEAEVVSMVTVPIYQASSTVLPLSTRLLISYLPSTH